MLRKQGQLLPGQEGQQAVGPMGTRVGLGSGAMKPDLNPLPNSGRASLPALLTGSAVWTPTPLPISQRGCCGEGRERTTLNTQHRASQGLPSS